MALIIYFEKKMRLYWYPIFLIVAAILLVCVALKRGPWIDEYWMQWLTEPSLSFQDIFYNRWLTDMHPPAYELSFYLIQQAGPLSIPAARLLNFAAYGFGLGFGGLLAWHYRQERQFLMLFSSAAVASSYFFNSFGNFRSYCFRDVFFCLLLCAIKIILAAPQPGQKKWPAWTVFLISLFISLNIHYFSIVITAVTVVIFALALLRQRRIGAFLAMGLSGTLFVLPTAIFAIMQASYLSSVTSNFWLNGGALDGYLVYEGVILTTLQTVGVYIFVIYRPLFLRGRDTANVPPAASDWLFSKLLFSSILIIGAIFFIGHLYRPLLTERYVSLLSFSLMAGLIAWATPTIERSNRTYSFVILNAFVWLFLIGSNTMSEKRWFETEGMIKDLLKACPTSRVIGARLATYEEKQIGIIMKHGYASLSQQLGIPLAANMEQTHWQPGALCPDIFWFAYIEAALLPIKKMEDMVDVFWQRYPGHAGCDVKMLMNYQEDFKQGAVFVVSNDPKSCTARK